MGRPRAMPPKRAAFILHSGDSDSDEEYKPGKPYNSPFTGRKKQATRKKSQDNKENVKHGNQKDSEESHRTENKEDVPWDGGIPGILKPRSIMHSSLNLVHCLQNITQGTQLSFWQEQAFNSPVIQTVKNMRVNSNYLGFDRRVTAVSWHPTNPNLVVVGSKGGDLALWNYVKDGHKPRTYITGHGPGGSIQSLKFDERNGGNMIYSVSIDGSFAHYNMETKERFNYLHTADMNHWYTSLDVLVSGKVLSVGDNKGYVNLLTQDGEKVWQHRLHRQKVTHIEFCPRMPWCFVTTSVDRSLKVWDIRKMQGSSSSLHKIMLEKPVNSAYFSRTDGGKLLTTDQHSEIRVYSCPSFSLSKVIPHPHRQFQHLTPIKASWHPLRDIIVVGRYPDKLFPGYVENEPRTVDFFDGVTGEILHQHTDRGCGNKIMSLNVFNHNGEALLTGAASQAWVWTPQFCSSCSKSKDSKNGKDGKDSDDDSDNDKDNKPPKPRKRNSGNSRRKTSNTSQNGGQGKPGSRIMKIDDAWYW